VKFAIARVPTITIITLMRTGGNDRQTGSPSVNLHLERCPSDTGADLNSIWIDGIAWYIVNASSIL